MTRSHQPAHTTSKWFSAFLVCAVLPVLIPVEALRAEDFRAADTLGRDYLKQIGRDLGAVAQSPLKWKGRDLAFFGAAAGAGIVLFSVDEDIRIAVHNNRTPGTKDAAAFFDHFGDGAVLTALMAGVYTTGLIADKPGWRRTALLGFESYVISSLFTAGIKTMAGRSRPLAEEGHRRFRPFSTASRRTSFPSGHTSAAWAVAAAVADGSESPVVDAICYSTAAMVSLARIYKDKHWASDVFFGAVLGYASAKMICRRNRAGDGTETSAGLSLVAGSPAFFFSISF
jgi:membrane-associated phospholipid phosphatase